MRKELLTVEAGRFCKPTNDCGYMLERESWNKGAQYFFGSCCGDYAITKSIESVELRFQIRRRASKI